MLTSIKGNGLERFITGANKCPDQYITQDPNGASPLNAGSGSRIDNPTFSAWIRTDHLFLSCERKQKCVVWLERKLQRK